MKRSLLCLGTVVAALLAAPAAHGQGSAVMTHSSCATAMGAAGVADPCNDGSAVLFNPAALALQQSVVGLGWTGITTSGEFEFDPALGGEVVEREESTSSVPFGFLNYRVSDRLAAAIGVFAPYGLGIFWPEEFEGRFVSYDTDLTNIYIQPTLAYALSDRISVGAGVDVILSSLELNQRVDLATVEIRPGVTFGRLGVPLGTDFANARLSGDATSYTFHVGALARLTDNFSVGARYLHSAEPEFEGDADFSQVATGLVLPPNTLPGVPGGTPLDAVLAQQLFAEGRPLADQAVATSLVTPAQLVIGVAYTPIPALRLLADYQWTGWSEWDEANIDFEVSPDVALPFDYQDTDTYRLGAEFETNESLVLRAGFIYNTAAQTEFAVSPLLPEAERNYYTLGLGYQFTEDLRIDAGYQLVDQSDRRGRVRPLPVGVTDPATLRELNVGVFRADANVANLTLVYQFGARR